MSLFRVSSLQHLPWLLLLSSLALYLHASAACPRSDDHCCPYHVQGLTALGQLPPCCGLPPRPAWRRQLVRTITVPYAGGLLIMDSSVSVALGFVCMCECVGGEGACGCKCMWVEGVSCFCADMQVKVRYHPFLIVFSPCRWGRRLSTTCKPTSTPTRPGCQP